MSPLQSAHPLPKSELLPLLPTHWPHDHCHQGIHWVLMVRHTRMQQWLSLCHLGAMVGKLLNSIPTAYVYHDKLVTYGFTLVIWGKPPIYTHTLCLQLHLICLAVFLFLYPNKDIFGGNPPPPPIYFLTHSWELIVSEMESSTFSFNVDKITRVKSSSLFLSTT